MNSFFKEITETSEWHTDEQIEAELTHLAQAFNLLYLAQLSDYVDYDTPRPIPFDPKKRTKKHWLTLLWFRYEQGRNESHFFSNDGDYTLNETVSYILRQAGEPDIMRRNESPYGDVIIFSYPYLGNEITIKYTDDFSIEDIL